MKTQTFPYAEIAPGTYEIGEVVKPSLFPNMPSRSVVTVGRTNVSFNPEGIHEPQQATP